MVCCRCLTATPVCAGSPRTCPNVQTIMAPLKTSGNPRFHAPIGALVKICRLVSCVKPLFNFLTQMLIIFIIFQRCNFVASSNAFNVKELFENASIVLYLFRSPNSLLPEGEKSLLIYFLRRF